MKTPLAAVGAVDRDRVRAQMRRWQDRVLDLTKSNPLIGLNRSRVAKLLAIDPDMNEIFSFFALGESPLKMPFVRKRSQEPQQSMLIAPEETPDLVVEPGDISFEAKPLDLMRRLRRIHDNARTTLDERGVTTLYLTLGTLRWKDDLFGDSVSPLWMVPCEFLQSFRRGVQDQHWEVMEEVWLSTFSFESLVIHRDLQALVGEAAIHPVVAALCGATRTAGNSESLPHDLDSLPMPTTVPIPVLPADSSQLAALTLSSLGHHVVVHGPPGTGKSQTIANLLADALARNKKVLFVSAKMAALNVVFDRLKQVGLQDFCLEAHSTKAGKQKVIDELRRTLEAETSRDGDALEHDLQALLRVRDQLNAYARELHTAIQPLGLSIYRANARLAQLDDVPDVRGPLPWTNSLDASRDDFDQRLNSLDELAGNSTVFDEGVNHPWYGFSPKTFGLSDYESLELALKTLDGLEEQIKPVTEKIGCLVSDARSLSLNC